MEAPEPGQPSNKYKIKIKNLINTVTIAQVTAAIDEIINTGGTLVFLNHILVTDTANTSTEYLTSNFQQVVDYAYEKKEQLDVITMTEYLNQYGL
ncbi:hypothetical protein [Priestia endophytica]|uniref:hypothetical protein n=1 Tax=Priestia endophytica TaxID=135735 RepID=UPI002280FDB7|nr:hypothetical protein [Priestia endophytica]MCY8234827.1 hypothetical protein [Priestia endophytica]